MQLYITPMLVSLPRMEKLWRTLSLVGQQNTKEHRGVPHVGCEVGAGKDICDLSLASHHLGAHFGRIQLHLWHAYSWIHQNTVRCRVA